MAVFSFLSRQTGSHERACQREEVEETQTPSKPKPKPELCDCWSGRETDPDGFGGFYFVSVEFEGSAFDHAAPNAAAVAGCLKMAGWEK
ncbi:hypothetical protein EYF80_051599 [Liparis tanakae]|uniref:Uncharacterized protein n=1 Tax=Liparis tanakae TaxID=230148 RepID=A0A4Z2FCX5_9TELE|nr:hypothetical protein EYF80_051599 [Liparis tanakae]